MFTIKNKFTSSLLAAVVLGVSLVGMAPTVTAAPTADPKACSTPNFRDISSTSANFYKATTWLRCEGISAGYSDGTFKVSRQITRGEVAALLYRHSGDKHAPGTQRDFKDVTPGSAYSTAISWLEAEGITNGYANGNFGVKDPIARGELSAFLYRYSGESFSSPSASPYSDMKKGGSFYDPAAWLYSTKMVSGYADGSFKPKRSVTRGEASAFMYAMETRATGVAPTYAVPVRQAVAKGTGGTGGVLHNKQNISWSNGTHTSQYHIYAEGLDKTKPMGIVVFLHGDDVDEFDDPNSTPMKQYRAMAKEKNLLFVVPKTPNAKGTWWLEDSNKYTGKWVTDLFDSLGTKYNVDLDKTYWLGFSGGADGIAEQIMQTHSDGWTGGAALIMSGGPVNWGYPGKYNAISSGLKANFKMHWVVGADDHTGAGGNAGSDGYDALTAARDGHAYYKGKGMKTSITEIPNTGHADAFPKGPAYFQRILDGKM